MKARKEAIEILKRVREELTDERKWTQGVYGRFKTGKSAAVAPTADRDHYLISPKAVSFCLIGMTVMQGFDGHFTKDARQFVRAYLGDLSIIGDFNDSHTHKEVLKFLDDRIAILKGLNND